MRIFVGAKALRALSLGLLVLTACSGESGSASSPTRAECAALRDRMVALRLDAVTTDRAQHAANLEAALGAGFVDGCIETMARSEVRCGLEAASGEALSACGER